MDKEDIIKSLKITTAHSEKESQKSIIFPKPLFDKFIEIFQMIFIVLNVLIALAEIFFLITGVLASTVWMIPLIHLILILFPVYYFKGRPPVKIELKTGLIILQKQILWKKIIVELSCNSILQLERKLNYIKGNYCCDIFARMNDNRKVLLVRRKVNDEKQYKVLSDFVAEFIKIKFEDSEK